MRHSSVEVFAQARAAVESGQLQSLRRLLDAHPKLVGARDDGGTLLHYTTGMPTLSWPSEAPDIVSLLVKRGADLDAGEGRDGSGETPLIHAASVNNVPVLSRLLALGADPERQGRHHQGIDTTLGYALFYGQDSRLNSYEEDCLAVLLAHGVRVPPAIAAALGRVEGLRADLEAEGEAARGRALAFAAHRGQEEATKACLQAGVPPSPLVDFFHERFTPLHAAAGQGHAGVAAILVEAGADHSMRDGRFDATPLEWARHQRHGSVVEVLSS